MFIDDCSSAQLKIGRVLDVRRLRLLREVSLRGTLAEVAAALHQSPSAVSQQLSLLEHEVGTPLLRKVGRGVELTPPAVVLVEHTERIMLELEQAATAVAAAVGEVAGTVRVAAFQSAAIAFMPQMLARLAEDHPLVRVTMSQRSPEQALHALHARELDLVIAVEYPGRAAAPHPDLDRQPVTTDRLWLAVPRSPDWQSITALDAATHVPWAMEPLSADSRAWTEQLCRAHGFEPDVRYESDDLETHAALVESGHAVAVLPDLMVLRRPPAARLLRLPGDPRRTAYTVTRRTLTASPAVQACREALMATVNGGVGN